MHLIPRKIGLTSFFLILFVVTISLCHGLRFLSGVISWTKELKLGLICAEDDLFVSFRGLWARLLVPISFSVWFLPKFSKMFLHLVNVTFPSSKISSFKGFITTFSTSSWTFLAISISSFHTKIGFFILFSSGSLIFYSISLIISVVFSGLLPDLTITTGWLSPLIPSKCPQRY